MNRRDFLKTSAGAYTAAGLEVEGFEFLVSRLNDRAMVQPVRGDTWEDFTLGYYPHLFCDTSGNLTGFADHHKDLWSWSWNLDRGIRPRPFVACWPRGGGKSTNAECVVVGIGHRRARRYALYMSGTQDQSDTHVAAVAKLLENPNLAVADPMLTRRSLTKYGHSRGWRRSRLVTDAPFTVDALGFDVASRGLKWEEARPDLIVLDDFDGLEDTPKTIAKKIRILTQTILPLGSEDCAVLVIQNRLNDDGIMARLLDGRAEFLMDRMLSGPFPALVDFAYEGKPGEYKITSGEPTWVGFSVERCEAILNTIGPTAFMREYQHETTVIKGGMYDNIDFLQCNQDQVPDLKMVTCNVDPATTEGDDSDSYGLDISGLGVDNKVYSMYSWEEVSSPNDALERALIQANKFEATEIGVETNQGGLTWETVYKNIAKRLKQDKTISRIPRFISVFVSSSDGSKRSRSMQMLADYEVGGIVHVRGTHQVRERALIRFPKQKPFDLHDAAWQSWARLRNRKKFTLV